MAFALHAISASQPTVARRREFIRLGAGERDLLTKMIPWATKNAPLIAREFYDWQFQLRSYDFVLPEARAKRNASLEALRRQLEQSQTTYVVTAFEARGRTGT
jgi:hypothetical protein